jgi:hypothetical protein
MAQRGNNGSRLSLPFLPRSLDRLILSGPGWLSRLSTGQTLNNRGWRLRKKLVAMSEKKLRPSPPQAARKACPVCGKSTYSLAGIHPQCAVAQSDALQKQLLRQQKVDEAKDDSQ